MAESSISGAVVSLGEIGTQVSFEGWTAPADAQDNSTFVVAVTNLGIAESEGVLADGQRESGNPCSGKRRSCIMYFEVVTEQRPPIKFDIVISCA